MRPRGTWDLLGKESLGQEAPLVSARSLVCHLHLALGWASSPSNGGRDILLYKVGSLMKFGTFK